MYCIECTIFAKKIMIKKIKNMKKKIKKIPFNINDVKKVSLVDPNTPFFKTKGLRHFLVLMQYMLQN